MFIRRGLSAIFSYKAWLEFPFAASIAFHIYQDVRNRPLALENRAYCTTQTIAVSIATFCWSGMGCDNAYLSWLWWLGVAWWQGWYAVVTQFHSFARHPTTDVAEQGTTHFTRRKPEWVIQEVLRLKVLVGARGCRVVADTFNGLHAAKSACTVGKTFVSACLTANQYALACLRKDMRNKLQRPVPVNAIWAIDLTFYTDASGKQQMALGILDHGSRLVTCLQTLMNKRSWTLLD